LNSQERKKAFSLLESVAQRQLGPLERQVMEWVWKHGSATVRDMLADGKMSQAYTTVMTTADRLFKKGLLDRVAEGKAFRYSPRHSTEELQRTSAHNGIRQLLDFSATPSLPLSYLVEELSSRDAKLLDELQELVERKRRELNTGKKA
jgi:predicted transcriptional regulator